ncbi:Sterile alpha motif domain-containing protein 7, partial [Lemmus lemmus]
PPRDVLSSGVTPAGPSQFCAPSQSGSSFVPNANMLNPPSGHFDPVWGILLPEPTKAVATRNKMFERHHTARTEMEMYSLYQQRRMERVNPKGLAGLGILLFYGLSCLGGPVGFQGRGTLPASDLHLHRSTSRHLQGIPILLTNRPHFTKCWGQKYRLRRGSVYQKPRESNTESFKNQAEEKDSAQMPVVPYKEEEGIQDPEFEVDNNRKSRETDENPTSGLANTCIELQPSQTKPSSPEATARDGGKEKPSEQVCEGHDEKNGLGLPVSILPLPGAYALGALSKACSSADIQKWIVDDVHDFIRSLPGCSD